MTETPLRLFLHGASGRMGQAILALLPEAPGLVLVGASAREPARLALPAGAAAVAAGRLDEAPAFDVLIDFSLPEAFDAALALAVARGAAFVSGTTGLSAAQEAALDAAAARVPVLWAANFSLGVAVLGALVKRAAAALPGWDCDIVEAHHVHKRDAPSGTALALGAQASAGWAAAGQGGDAAAPRAPAYASLRAGDIVGEHLVQFAGIGERIELVHRATRRDIFARGALEAARRLPAQAPGRHALAALLLGADAG